MRVLRPAVQQHELRVALAPDQDADLLTGLDLDELAAQGRRPCPGQSRLGRVVRQQPELTVFRQLAPRSRRRGIE
jgi:hypothetical protein